MSKHVTKPQYVRGLLDYIGQASPTALKGVLARIDHDRRLDYTDREQLKKAVQERLEPPPAAPAPTRIYTGWGVPKVLKQAMISQAIRQAVAEAKQRHQPGF